MSNVFDRMVSENGAPSESDELSDKEPSSLRAFDGEAMGDTPRTSCDVKKVTQELLKHGYLEEAQKGDLFRRGRSRA